MGKKGFMFIRIEEPDVGASREVKLKQARNSAKVVA